MKNVKFKFETEKELLAAAANVIKRRAARRMSPMVTSSHAVKRIVRDLFTYEIADSDNEKFCVLYLDTQHRFIESRVEFTGTVDGASVYPRVIAKHALELNASAVVIAHNHPSGCTRASNSDRAITRRLQDALALVDVRVIDHLICADDNITSFAECGLM